MSQDMSADVVVVGSGAAGLTTAIVARKRGLQVIVLEKEPVFGGTTAISGGVLWIPLNAHGRKQNPADTKAAAKTFLKHETGNYFDEEAVETFLDNGPKMVEFLERETEMQFVPTLYPDYHPDAPGGVGLGRSILAKPYDIRGLGKDMARLKPPLETITFMGMMFNSSNADLKHFFRATKSLTSFLYVAKRLAAHVWELVRYGKGVQVTSGNALAARLAASALKLGAPILTQSPVSKLIVEDGRVTGVVVAGKSGEFRVKAKQAVVLACGGFPHDAKRIAEAYPHLRRGGEHLSPTPESNTGDGVAMAEAAGARVEIRFADSAAWMPASRVPFADGRTGVFPHLLDRYKPGIIGVLRSGRRFTNESNSYHDVGAALIRACEGERETAMWLICDSVALGKYGLGYAKPAPVPVGPLIRRGYLVRADTLAGLAAQTGIDATGLVETVAAYNQDAVRGEDPAFGRGTTAFNRYLADPENLPNPCVAPIGKGPYYAVKVVMGDLGTFDGVRASACGEALSADGAPVPGLYVVGNDRESMMGGAYPGAGITHGPNMTFAYVTANTIADRAQAAAR